MWLYSQSSGRLQTPSGNLFAFGFAGQGVGLNNPAHQDLHNVGPLPVGDYKMTGWIEDDSKSNPPGHLGLCVIILTPVDESKMLGRSGFRIHGARSLDRSGLAAFLTSSEGCVCLGDCTSRRFIWNSGDRLLRVVA